MNHLKRKSIDLNIDDQLGCTLLLLARFKGQFDVVNFIIETLKRKSIDLNIGDQLDCTLLNIVKLVRPLDLQPLSHKKLANEGRRPSFLHF